MAVRWQNVEMPLGGADQYTDAPHVLPGKMRELENIRLRRPPTHSKRYGFERLPVNLLASADTIENGRRLSGHGEETILCSGDKLYTFSHLANEWATRGEVSQCFVERRSTWSEMSNLSYYDGAFNQNVYVCARTGGGRPNAVVIDMTTETIVSVQELAFTSDHVRVLAVGDYIYVISGASYTRIDVTSGNYEFPAIAAFSGVSNVGSDLLPDVAALGTSHIVMAFADSSNGNITVHRIAVSNNTSDANANKAEDPVQTIAVHATSGEGVLVVYDGPGASELRAWSLSVALADVVGPVSLGAGSADVHHAGIARINSDLRVVVWRNDGSRDTWHRVFSLAGGVQGAAAVDTDSVSPASKPFQFGARTFGWVAYKSAGARTGTGVGPVGGDQETFYLLQYTDDDGAALDPAVWTGTAAVGIAECIDYQDSGADPINFLPSVSHIGSSRYECPMLIKDRFEFSGDADQPIITARRHLERLRADFDVAGQLHQTATWNGGLVIAGGRPSWYDGNLCVELGFAWFPEDFELTVGTGVLTAGSYDVCLCYEWTDALGNIHRSAPSEAVTRSVANTSSIDVEMLETVLTNKAITAIPTVGKFTDTRFVLYRTIAGPGPIFYRSPLSTGGSATLGTTSSFGTQGDSDADLILSDVLYTTGGILENAVPPPCKYVVKHVDRLWLGGLEEPDLLWFSQPAVFREGPRFNPQLSIRTPRAVTGLASMDAKLVVFHEDGITCIEGNGPPASGGLDLGLILYEVPSDVGCIDWRSICVYRDGVFFQSRKGLYRLGRDLSVTFVGAPVKGYLDAFPTVFSAVDLAERSEVVFGVFGTSTSRRLVFNYEVGEWSVDTCPEVETAASLVYNATTDKWVYGYVIRDTGAVFREKDGGYDDLDKNGTVSFITSKWVTPWFRLNTLQDWLRVKGVTLLGTRPGAASSAGVRVRVGFDYEDTTWAETHTFTSTEVNDAIVNGRLQLEVQFGRMRCEAVRLEIIDTGPGEQGTAGIELQSLVFTGGFQARDRYRVDRDAARK